MRVGRLGAAAVLTVLLVAPQVGPARSETTWMLPTLRQAPPGCPAGFQGDAATCTDWDVCPVVDVTDPNAECVHSGPIEAVRLRFTSAVDNIGDGPLLLYGHRDGGSMMTVRQAFQTGRHGPIPGSYNEAQRWTPATMYYEPADMHQHWHMLGFERFELRTLDGATLVTDRKNGFCLGDRYVTADAERLPHAVHDDASPEGELARYLTANTCGFQSPAATDVTEGISVGRGDDYAYNVDFQWLDISHVPSGIYNLVNSVNTDRALLQANYDDNSSSVTMAIQWPDGAATAPTVITTAPEVTLLRACPGLTYCGVEGRGGSPGPVHRPVGDGRSAVSNPQPLYGVSRGGPPGAGAKLQRDHQHRHGNRPGTDPAGLGGGR